jgi:adenylate cyclase
MRNLFRRKFNLGQTCGFLAALQLLVAGLLITLLIYTHLLDTLRQQLQEDSFRQLQRLSMVIAPAVLQEDRISLNVTLGDWARGPEMPSIRVLDTGGQIIAESGRQSSGRYINLPLTQDDKVLGSIEATINTETVDRIAGRYLSLALMATGLCALLGGLIAYHLAERSGNYLKSLTRQLRLWANDQPLQIPEQNPGQINEFIELRNSLTQLQQNESRRLALEQAMNQFMYRCDKPRTDSVTYQRCALLYFEISELDVLQARLSAQELADCLDGYHRLLSQAAKLYNGTLDRYQGDGIVMIFGLPDGNERDTLHCIYAAQLCLGLIQHARRKQLAPINLRCAAHWGPVLLAPVSQDNNTQYNLIGDTLYWASHLARSSEEDRVLVSQTLITELPVEIGMEWDEGPLVADLQGNSQTNFWLRTLPEKSRTLIERQIHHIASMTEKTS